MNRVPTPQKLVRVRPSRRVTPRRCLGGATLVAVLTAVLAQAAGLAQPVPTNTVLTVSPASLFVGQTVVAHVVPDPGFDFPPELDWDDGSPTETVPQWSDATYPHTYTSPGTFTVRVTEDPYYEDTTVEVVVFPTPSITLDPSLVATGAPVTASLGDVEPDGAPAVSIDWGDGTVEPAADGELQHSYATEGAFVARLMTADGVIPGTESAVTVNDALGSARMEVDPSIAAVGEVVEATVTNLNGSATLEWGDGDVTPVPSDGAYDHAYRAAGGYTVLLKAQSGAVLGADAVTVRAGGHLEVDPPSAVVGEPVTFTASGLAPGLLYRLDAGDGTLLPFQAPSDGTERVDHVYQVPDPATRASLWLVADGGETRVALLPVPVLLPVPTETIEAVQTGADPVAGVLEANVTLTGLLVGQHYQLNSPYGRSVELLAEDTVEQVSMRFEWEGVADLRLDLVSDGFAHPRASGSVDLRWPRPEVQLTVSSPIPVLVGDVVTITATGLTPGLRYAFLSGRAGFAAQPFVADATRRDFQVAYGDQPGARTVTLSAFYPNGGATTEERVAELTFDRSRPTGAISFEGPTIVYGSDSSVTLSELIAGRRYRLQLGPSSSVTVTAPEGGATTVPYPFEEQRGDLRLYALLTDYETLVDTAPPPGVTFSGAFEFRYEGFYPDHTVQVHLRDLAPSHAYTLDFGDGQTAAFEADANGAATLEHVFGGTGQGTQEWLLRLYLADFGTTDPPLAAYTSLYARQMPPLTLSFGHGVRLRVLSLDRTFEYPESNDALSGRGVLEDLVLGGRLQSPIEFRFEDLSVGAYGERRVVRSGTAESVAEGPSEGDGGGGTFALPVRLNGLTARFDTFRLSADQAPDIRGSATLPDGSRFDLLGALMFNDGPENGMMFSLRSANDTPIAIGDSGWEFTSSSGGGAYGILDLSTSGNYHLLRDGVDALVFAYSGWTELETAPPVSPTDDAWTGIVFTDSDVHRAGGQAIGYRSPYATTVAWTGSGYSTYIRADPITDPDGKLRVGGWAFELESSYTVAVVDSQVVRHDPALAKVYLPLFGADTLVTLTPKGGRGAGFDIRTAAPVTLDFGSSALVAGVGVFADPGYYDVPIPLVFPSALWSLDGDLASDPEQIDTTTADTFLASLHDPVGASDALRADFDDAKATAETALNLYRLQLLLGDLTLQPDGAVSLGGQQWQTLAKAPTLDMYGFPYLAAGAQIGVKQGSGVYAGEYAIGLRGSITIGDILGAEAAPSWFYIEDGKPQRWEFEGFSLTFGGLEGVPFAFSLIAGGTIDLVGNDLEFHGGGSLTVQDQFNVQVAGVFGQYEGTTYWFVYAGSDLALAEKPIEIKVNGVPILSFYAFRGGIGSHLKLTTYGGADDDCRVDDADIPGGTLPSVVVHARQCLDPGNPVSFLAGTLIGSPSEVPDGYGFLWHLDGNLVINASSNLELSGRGWTMKTLDDGYRANATPNLAGRFSIDARAITATLCAGPGDAPISGLDCSSLQPFRIAAGGLTLVEVKGVAQFHASWSDSEYFFALGTYFSPLYLYTFPNFKYGYLVIGEVKRGGLIDPRIGLPVNGIFAAGSFGWSASYDKSGSLWLCDWHVWANATFGFGAGFRVYAPPGGNPSFGADVDVYGSASAGASGCGIGGGLGVSMRAEGRVSGPTPFRFSGDIHVSISVPVIDDIDVSFYKSIDIPVPG